MSILVGLFTLLLIIVSVFLVLIILMQKSKSDGGMGAAMGGGMAEATFGADTGNVLTKATRYASIVFFVVSFMLYLGHLQLRKSSAAEHALPQVPAQVELSPATTSEATEAPAAEVPATDVPATDAPAGEAPAAEAPATEATTTEPAAQP